jgi:hypothetical protein
MKIDWKTKTEQCLYEDLKKGDKIIIANNLNIVTEIIKEPSGYLNIFAEAHTEYGIFYGINISGVGSSIITRVLD